MKLYFKVKAQASPSQSVYIIGSIPQLGLWDQLNAMKLIKKQNSIWQSKDCLELKPNQRIQFKLIMKSTSDQIRWQSLPNNTNRKFKITQDIILQMQWNSTKGKKLQLKRKSFRLRGIPSIIISSPLKRNKKDTKKVFDPFKDAQYSESDREETEQDFENRILQKKLYRRKQFEQIFYQNCKSKMILGNSRIQTFETLFIISKMHPSQNQYSQKILENYLKLNLNICWIYNNSNHGFKKSKNPKFIELNPNKIKEQQKILALYNKNLETIITENSICIIIDIQLSRLKLKNSINGLILGDTNITKQQIKNYILSQKLQYINSITFYNPEHIQFFLNSALQKIKQTQKSIEIYIQNVNSSINLLKTSSIIQQDIFYKFYIQMKQQQLLQLKNKKDQLKKLNIQQINLYISQSQNCLFVFDFSIIQKYFNQPQYKSFLSNLIILSTLKNNMICFITQKSKSDIQTKYCSILKSNIIILADSGKQIKLGTQWIIVLEKHMRNLQILRKKFNQYYLKYDGIIEQGDNFIGFKCDQLLTLQKIHQQLKNLLIQQKYLKIIIKDKSIYIAWKVRQNKSSLESVIQLRCMIEGRLDFLFVMTGQHQKDYIFDEIQTIIKNFQPLFKKTLKKNFAIEGMRFCSGATYFIESQEIKKLIFTIK